MNVKLGLTVAIPLLTLLACGTEETRSVGAIFTEAEIETAIGLRDAALDSGGAHAILSGLIDAAPKRLAGSPGDALARDWAVETLESLGFDRVWVETFTMQGWQRVSASAVVTSGDGLELDVTSLGKSVSTPDGGIQAEIAHFRSFAELEAADADTVAGKIVFISNRMERALDGSGYGPANVARSRGHELVAAKGGAALLIRSIGTDDHDAPHTGAMSFGDSGASQAELDQAYIDAWAAPYGELTVAAAAISNQDSDALVALLEGGDALTASVDIRNVNMGEIVSHNIIGEITGSERPDEIVITGGHIDAWDTGVGAMDDGMGVAITMQAAAMIAALPERPARTIRYVAFGAEELGLLGAKAYAAAHADEDHVFGIESDFGIGRVWRLAPRVASDSIAVLDVVANEVLAPMNVPFQPDAQGFPGPDLIPLVAYGMPGASLNGDGLEYFDLHHTAEDTLDKIDANDLDFNTAAYAALLYLVAEYDGRFDNFDEG